jgi:3-methyladenine DNA glycosylase AlkD
VYFHSHEPNEPPHVHVDRDDLSAKFWLNPVALARNLGFAAPELRRIHRLVAENQELLLEKWHERFGA